MLGIYEFFLEKTLKWHLISDNLKENNSSHNGKTKGHKKTNNIFLHWKLYCSYFSFDCTHPLELKIAVHDIKEK